MSAIKTQSSLSQQEGMQAVDLTKLNLMQLTQFKNGLDTDIQFYQVFIYFPPYIDIF